LLSSPNQDNEELQKSIAKLTPYSGDFDFKSDRKATSKFLEECDNYSPMIDTIPKKDKHTVLDITSANFSIINIDNKENMGDKMNFHCSK